MYYIYIFIVTYGCKNCRQGKEIRSIFYTKAFRICSSKCNFSTAKNKFVAFTK